MYGLTKKQKLKFVLQKIEELEISSYEIGKKTGLSVAGLDKLINGSVKNPHEKTLNEIINFLESKALGTNLNTNNTQNLVSEPERENLTKESSNYMKELLDCRNEVSDLFKKVMYLQNLLRKHNIEFKDYFEKLENLDK